MGTVLEFYCGIGGLRFAYEMALDALPPTHPLKGATHVVSFDISASPKQHFSLLVFSSQLLHRRHHCRHHHCTDLRGHLPRERPACLCLFTCSRTARHSLTPLACTDEPRVCEARADRPLRRERVASEPAVPAVQQLRELSAILTTPPELHQRSHPLLARTHSQEAGPRRQALGEPGAPDAGRAAAAAHEARVPAPREREGLPRLGAARARPRRPRGARLRGPRAAPEPHAVRDAQPAHALPAPRHARAPRLHHRARRAPRAPPRHPRAPVHRARVPRVPPRAHGRRLPRARHRRHALPRPRHRRRQPRSRFPFVVHLPSSLLLSCGSWHQSHGDTRGQTL